jgi:N-acetylglutamate synthase-like GNAT family acetyltransferase
VVEHVAQETRVVPAAGADHAQEFSVTLVIVREFEERDLDACRSLFEELVETHRRLYPDGDVGSTFELPHRVFVAEEDGRLAGFAGLYRHGRHAELEPIVVLPDRRAGGVGRALVERVVREARDGGAVRIFARPTARNRDAIRFLHACGFDGLGYVHLQIDFEQRERRPGERIADRDFRV